jgi:hypothetical protein
MSPASLTRPLRHPQRHRPDRGVQRGLQAPPPQPPRRPPAQPRPVRRGIVKSLPTSTVVAALSQETDCSPFRPATAVATRCLPAPPQQARSLRSSRLPSWGADRQLRRTARPGRERVSGKTSSASEVAFSEYALRPREQPANLSGSRPETHENRSPAGATCCYSLLLDPHATMTSTCTNGCSHWSPHEENRPRFFLIRDAL